MNQYAPDFSNYCVGFIDLLGQRDEYRDQGLLPVFTCSQDKEAFTKKGRRTIGAIHDLQNSAAEMAQAASRIDSSLRNSLPGDLKQVYDEMRRVQPKQQRWSDGLVSYFSLMTRDVKCPMNGVFDIFVLAGSLCFLGLAKRRPVRGAIEVAWGVELRDGELYGAVVAKAYELESKVAQYPRIVVSPRALNYLKAHLSNDETDYYSRFNSTLADVCLQMLAPDSDGYYILHYLGEGFRQHVSKKQHTVLYAKAFEYVSEQLEQSRRERNTKLALRYTHLFSYFSTHRPQADNVQP